jgi:hypothetical protein
MVSDMDKIDIVYTWVDDSFPGYLETLERYSKTVQDRNPNRTRDNLDILKYSMRSLERFAPFVRNVYLVSCAPQIPRWMNVAAPGLKIVHHDAIMGDCALPTFNSFAIVSCLSRIDGLSQRFLYVEDDMLFGRPVALSDFATKDGRLKVYPRVGRTMPASQRLRSGLSGWNAGLTHSNHLLDTAFRPRTRYTVNHVPMLIDKGWFEEMAERWHEDFAATRQSRFRSPGNVAPEYLYPYFLAATGRAEKQRLSKSYRTAWYGAFENFTPLVRLRLAVLTALDPKIVAFNDDFGQKPNPAAVRLARAALEKRWPVKSRFEL